MTLQQKNKIIELVSSGTLESIINSGKDVYLWSAAKVYETSENKINTDQYSLMKDTLFYYINSRKDIVRHTKIIDSMRKFYYKHKELSEW